MSIFSLYKLTMKIEMTTLILNDHMPQEHVFWLVKG